MYQSGVYETFDTEGLKKIDADIIAVSEMAPIERLFLNGICRKEKPRNVLEVGVSSGASSAVILNAIQDYGGTLYSIDLLREYYQDLGQKAGFIVGEQAPHLLSSWRLFTGGRAYSFLKDLNVKFDMCLLDTMHTNPGEILDYLQVLPFLNKNAIVVIHDISLYSIIPHHSDHLIWKNKPFVTTCGTLFATLQGDKFVPPYSDGRIANIGAVRLSDHPRASLDEIFHLLSMPWRYDTPDAVIAELRDFILGQYGEKYASIFSGIVKYQKIFMNATGLTPKKADGAGPEGSPPLSIEDRLEVLEKTILEAKIIQAEQQAKEIFNLTDVADPDGKNTENRFHVVNDLLWCFWLHRNRVPFLDECLPWVRGLAEDPKWGPTARDCEARMLYASGELPAAVARAEQAVAAEPDNSSFRATLCHLRLETGAFDLNGTSAQDELCRNPRKEWALHQLVLTLQAKADPSGTMDAARRALAKNPFWEAGRIALAWAYRVTGALPRAVEVLNNKVRYCSWYNPSSPCFAVLCDLYFESGAWSELEALAKSLRENAPSLSLPHTMLSKVYEAGGELDTALSELQIALELFPGHMARREDLLLFLIRNSMFKQAEDLVRGDVFPAPDEACSLFQRSLLCEARGDLPSALEYARQAQALQPQKRSFSAAVAELLRKGGDYSGCEELCCGKLAKERNQGWAWRGLYYCACEAGEREKAAKYGALAIAVEPANSALFSRDYSSWTVKR